MKIFEELINDERVRQDEKWGEQNHHPAIWLAILTEELGELSTEILNRSLYSRMTEMQTELIQVAAVCKAMWESGKRNGWM